MDSDGMDSSAAQPSWNRRVNNTKPSERRLDEDVELMLRVREGDDKCFAVLVKRHRNAVMHYLYRMVLNQAAAEDLAQEVFLRVYRFRATYVATAKFTTWLFRIATHLALNWIRDGRHEKIQDSLDQQPQGALREVQDRCPTVEQEMLFQAKLREVRQAIESLPSKQRAAVVMHKYEELGYSEIAQVLRCSEAAVKSLLFRAYESLRIRLAHMA